MTQREDLESLLFHVAKEVSGVGSRSGKEILVLRDDRYEPGRKHFASFHSYFSQSFFRRKLN